VNKTSARILAVGLPLAAVAATGAAFAYYTSAGSGTVTAGTSAASITPLTLSAAPVNGLVPGDSITVDVQATNPNGKTSVGVSTLTAAELTSGSDACDEVSGATVTASPSAVVIAPNQSAKVGSITVTMPNSPTTDQSACKGKTFTVKLSAA
jgi:hypothetical protein